MSDRRSPTGHDGGVARVTLQTIADELGVSRMTVSNAFSKPDQLSIELRAKILETAAGLGYAGPDPAARNLARGRAGTVGILLTDHLPNVFDDEVTAGFVGAIAAELAPTGSAITLLTSREYGDFMPARDIALDGALVYSCHEEHPATEWLIRRQLPLVFVDQRPPDGYDSVNIADREGARLAAQHVIDLGHTQIAIATTSYEDATGILDDPFESDNPVSGDRLRGWFDAIRDAGLDAFVVQVPKHSEKLDDDVVAALLDHDPRPTAILCISDVVAVGIMRAAFERGISIPDQLSVVGFDGSLLAQFAQPSLTTIRQDVVRKGHVAAAALLRRMSGQIIEPEHVVLPVELVIGDSTAPPPTQVVDKGRGAGRLAPGA
jgi:DNA-binding LacI/PurR family transcriptional regulator